MNITEMNTRVLVAFASKYGATAEIAESIGQVLREAGLYTDIMPVDRVEDPSPYDAVVLGSAVYMSQWRKEAARFLTVNEHLLAERPVWLFSSGPTGAGDFTGFMKGLNFPEVLQPIADRIVPRDIVIFPGKLDLDKLNPVDKWMINNWKSPLGDYRDWEVIKAWAATIARTLLSETISR